MAGRRPAPSRADLVEDMRAWANEQRARAAALGHAIEDGSRRAIDEVTRTGRDVTASIDRNFRGAATTPARAQSVSRQGPSKRTAVSARSTSARAPGGRGSRSALGAGASGAVDAFTLGLADPVTAGARAANDALHGADLGEAWRARRADERARDLSDAQHHRTARTIGQVIGTGAGLAVAGPIDGLLAGGARILETTPLALRELRALSAGGAAAGVGNQALSDVERGHIGTVGDYAGAAVGGGVGALASIRGRPGAAGQLGGATTAVAQDLLNGRKVDWGGAARNAQAAGYLAAPAGLAGRAWSDDLTNAAKGELGEAMGRARSRLSGQRSLGKRAIRLNSGRRTIADDVTHTGLVTEQKFGPTAKLRPNQREAYAQFGDGYRVDHFLPRDVGAIVAFPFGLLGPRVFHQDS
jgi:hypothetical protein